MTASLRKLEQPIHKKNERKELRCRGVPKRTNQGRPTKTQTEERKGGNSLTYSRSRTPANLENNCEKKPQEVGPKSRKQSAKGQGKKKSKRGADPSAQPTVLEEEKKKPFRAKTKWS